MLRLDKPIEQINGVGPKLSERFQKLGLFSVKDLIYHYPRRWDDFSDCKKISQLRLGNESVIKAKIVSIAQSRTNRRWMSLIEAKLEDESGTIKAIWFNQPFLMNVLKEGDQWLFLGKVNWDFKNKEKNIAVTQYEKEPIILPIYAETVGLTSKFLRKITKPIVEELDHLVRDYLPEEIRKENNLVDLVFALKNIHFPEKVENIEIAQRRLAFDELFLIALRMLDLRKELLKEMAPSMQVDEELLKKFVKSLPFELTNAQRKSAWEIIKDLEKNTPMNRLLEGDVGSGKTVVAAMAALVTIKNGYQVAWLAPTEILANQHYNSMQKILAKENINIGLLTSANKRADLLKDNLIIGTHAILQKNVQIPNLGLIIIDEQHRFGVKQRAWLRGGGEGENVKGAIPHLLSMTATPIPRTLTLAIYGDLDLSIINQMPSNRKRVITKIIDSKSRQKAYEFIRDHVKSGRQVFVVCPLIEQKESTNKNLFETDRKSVIEEYEKLSKNIFPDLNIGLLHGKMKSKEKEEAMRNFAEKKIDVLVSTAVIEVGIDIPNATIMMIESAERFGLAQLHQFRGRVGRGEYQSFCFLFSQGDANSNRRLAAMVDCFDGFELAQKDLEIRGPGELVGIRQSGLADLKMASLSNHELIKEVRKAAEKVVESGLEKYPELADKLKEFEIEHHFE